MFVPVFRVLRGRPHLFMATSAILLFSSCVSVYLFYFVFSFYSSIRHLRLVPNNVLFLCTVTIKYLSFL